MKHLPHVLVAAAVVLLSACSESAGDPAAPTLSPAPAVRAALAMPHFDAPPGLHLAPADNPFLGTWSVTSIVIGNTEVLETQPITMTLIFDRSGGYEMQVANDEGHEMCPAPATSCSWEGTYTFTRTTLTLDEQGGPDPGPGTAPYAACAGRILFFNPSDEDWGRWTLMRTQNNCYATDCG